MPMIDTATAADPSDHALLAAFAGRRDDRAFAELLRRHAGLVHATCRRRLGEAEADDAAQAVFLVLARKAGDLARSGTPLAPWLHTAAGHVASNHARMRERRRRHEEAAAMEPRPPVSGPGPQASGDAWAEVRAHLDGYLDGLPAAYRDALVLHYLEGRDRPGTAAALGIGDEALKKRLTRGLDRLRHLLAKRGVAVPTAALAAGLAAHGAEPATASALACASVTAAGTTSSIAQSLAAGALTSMKAAMTIATIGTVALSTLAAAGIAALGTLAIAAFSASESKQAEPPPAPPAPASIQPVYRLPKEGFWYVSLLDWRLRRDGYTGQTMKEMLPDHVVEAALVRVEVWPEQHGRTERIATIRPTQVWMEKSTPDPHGIDTTVSPGATFTTMSSLGWSITQSFPTQGGASPSSGNGEARLKQAPGREAIIDYAPDVNHDYGILMTGLGIPDLSSFIAADAFSTAVAIPPLEASDRRENLWHIRADQPALQRRYDSLFSTSLEILGVRVNVVLDVEARGKLATAMVWDDQAGLPLHLATTATLHLKVMPHHAQPAAQPPAEIIEGDLHIRRWVCRLAGLDHLRWPHDAAALHDAVARTALPVDDGGRTVTWRQLAERDDAEMKAVAAGVMFSAEHPPKVTISPQTPVPSAPRPPAKADEKNF